MDQCRPWKVTNIWQKWSLIIDVDPDPYIFGPPGSGSIIINTDPALARIRIHHYLYGSGFGTFHHQAKIVWKTLIFTVLWLLYDFLSLKNDVNLPSKSNQQKNFLWASWRPLTNRTGSRRRLYRSADPDPYQNVTDPQHCLWFRTQEGLSR